MDEIATISHQYYDNHLRGGEGHMEVGKLIQSVEQRKAHMMISVKPFGCMPSSGVSDGVQSLVTARHPDAIFCAIETTGDGAVNVQSRVLMYLFKARQKAQQEYDRSAHGIGPLTAGSRASRAPARLRRGRCSTLRTRSPARRATCSPPSTRISPCQRRRGSRPRPPSAARRRRSEASGSGSRTA